MAKAWIVIAAGTAGCSHRIVNPPAPDDAAPDAVVAVDAKPDAVPDAACRTPLYVGGTDPLATGWIAQAQPVETLAVEATDVKLTTSTNGGTTSGGQLLLAYANAIPTTPPFGFEVELAVDKVATHNPLDAAVAIMPSFTAPFGTMAERSAMIYLDTAKLGYADDASAVAATVADGNFHVVRVVVDAAGAETVAFDGTTVLTRAGVTTNGTIAIGDQSNEANLDATTRIRSVVRLDCLP